MLVVLSKDLKLADRLELNRCVVVGSSCSGKSTLSRKLSSMLNLEHIELDAFFWQENWQARSSDSFRTIVRAKIPTDHWVVDGNYSAVRDYVWSNADTVIWLNLPLRVVLFRGLRRALHHGFSGEKICGNNTESLAKTFLSKRSLLI